MGVTPIFTSADGILVTLGCKYNAKIRLPKSPLFRISQFTGALRQVFSPMRQIVTLDSRIRRSAYLFQAPWTGSFME